MLEGGGLGVFVGAIASSSSTTAGWVVLFFLVGFALIMAGQALLVVEVLRGQRRLDRQLREGSAELTAGSVAGSLVPGRVVRTRPSRRLPGWLASSSTPVTPDSSLVVVTALVSDSAQRVAAAAPTGLRLTPGQSVLLRLHPTRAEVALLDDTLGPQAVTDSGQDPRWNTVKLPTDATVRGRAWLPWLLGSAVVGGVLGTVLPRVLS